MPITTLNIVSAGAINYTHMTDSSADWSLVPTSTYFYDKTDKLVHYKDTSGNILDIFSVGGVTSVTGTSPIVSSGGAVPAISIPQATGSTNGYLSSGNWTIFNNKLSQAYQTIEDEGSVLTQRTNVNFTGAGVSVTDAGGKTVVTINGGATGGTVKTIQLGISDIYATTISYGTLGGNTLVFNSAGSGSGVLQNNRWQFVVPADFVSGAVFKITTYRPTVNFTGTPQSNLQVYINNVLSNIDGTASFYIRPLAIGVYQTFTFTLTTTALPGDTITVNAQTALSNSENLYIRDMSVNYQS